MKKVQRISMGCLFLCPLFIFSVSSAMATTIIAIRTGNELVLAADSLSRRVISGPTSFICKITQIKNVFVAFSGRISAEGPINFNLMDIARDVFSRKGTLQEKIAFFSTTIKRNLETLVNDDRKNKERFDRLYSDKDRFISGVIIAVVTDSYPTLYSYDFFVASSAEQSAKIEMKESESTFTLGPGQYHVVLSGEYNAFLNDLPDAGSSLIEPFNTIENARSWIRKEAVFAPDMVGLPVDILRLTPGRAEWIQHKIECQEINENEIKGGISENIPF
jgi:hypothetical protein